ncbi:MAG: ribonuclease Z, partial [Candidatus Amulumruptor sp.]|nr:ribonuclease Z [Candidatus Amulumruptor sp.]
TILGCGSATPTLRHHPSAQALNFRDRVMLIDCAEGTQLQMRRYSIPFSRVSDIFISHLHGDHCLGLPGFLSTLTLQDQKNPVTIHMPQQGIDLFDRMISFFSPGSKDLVKLKPIPDGINVIAETRAMKVTAFPLYHRMPCFGFIFRENERPRRLLRDVAETLGIPHSLRNCIKAGADWCRPSDGRVFANSELTAAPLPSLSYAYCSDTMADSRVAKAIRGVDVVYHETTYLSDMAAQAHARGHSTAAEAARIAAEAEAKILVIGHYSKRYTSPEPLVAEAASIFPGTVIAADEGLVIDVARLNQKL